MSNNAIKLNGKSYQWPKRPIVVVCIDGGDPEYMDNGFSAGSIPKIQRFRSDGFYAIATGSMPSFTCPNNMSIVTGTEPEAHGISGNFFLNRETNQPIVMTGPELLRLLSNMR